MLLYHADLGLPEWFVKPGHRVMLDWSRHADKARTNDRYGQIPKFDSIPLNMFSVVEIGVEKNKLSKIVVRGHWTNKLDVVFVLIPQPGKWFVKTVWINERNDAHKTLDRSKYVH